MRLIDAHELIKNWYDEYIKFMTREEIESMDGIIENAPTINAIPIPKDATNGDMIKAIFPNIEVKERNNVYEVYFGVGTAIQFFNHQWWNAPYEQEEQNG